MASASSRAIIAVCTGTLARKQRLLVTSAAANHFASVIPHQISRNNNGAAHFSTKPPPSSGKKSSMNPFSGMWDNYQDSKTRKTFREQMENVQKVDKWTLGAYLDQLGMIAKSWKSKIPGVSGSSDIKNAKESYEIVDCLAKTLGPDATVDDIHNIGRKEKLLAANDAGVTVERINQEVRNFEVSTQTHTLMMLLKEQGKPIPETPDEMRDLVQVHAKKLMTKEDKERMSKMMQQKMKKDMMKRRR